MSHEIIQIHPERYNQTTAEAAVLVEGEIYGNSSVENLANYLLDYNPAMTRSYGIVNAQSELIAVADAAHNVDDEGMRTTRVDHIAVRSDLQRQGLGRTLMKHIAEMAVESGDEVIFLMYLHKAFYIRIGFREREIGLVATPAEILSS
jgi:GNAT superfamily N-acetyltransferase